VDQPKLTLAPTPAGVSVQRKQRERPTRRHTVPACRVAHPRWR